MSSKKANNSKSKSNANKTDKRAQSLAQDNRNGSLRSADYDELSTGDELKPEPLDPEKYETFRRIASAEESEELGICCTIQTSRSPHTYPLPASPVGYG